MQPENFVGILVPKEHVQEVFRNLSAYCNYLAKSSHSGSNSMFQRVNTYDAEIDAAYTEFQNGTNQLKGRRRKRNKNHSGEGEGGEQVAQVLKFAKLE